MEDLVKANKKKVWTTVSLRVDQETKLKILERANKKELNLNQWMGMVIGHHLSDSRVVNDREMIDKLLELIFSLNDRVAMLQRQKAELGSDLMMMRVKTGELTDDHVAIPRGALMDIEKTERDRLDDNVKKILEE